MKAKSPIAYVACRLISPVGLMLQTGYLSRGMDPNDFAWFLNLYAMAVVASAMSDGGARHLFFAEARRVVGGGHDVSGVITRACGTKAAYSAALAAVATALLFLGWSVGSVADVWTVLLVGVVLPVGDVGLTGLRAIRGATSEVRLLLAEQCVILLGLVLAQPLAGWTPHAAMLLIGTVGLVRMATSTGLLLTLKKDFGSRKPSAAPPLESHGAYLRLSVVATISIVLAQLFHRYPAISLLDVLTTMEYSVFVAFLAVLLRGQLVMQGLLHAWYGTSNAIWRRLGSSSLLLALSSGGLALVLMLPVIVFPQLWVRLYLGPEFVGAAVYASYAGAAMLLCYPLFVLSIMLQYERRNFFVVVGAGAGVLLQMVTIKSGWVDGAPVISYLAGVTLYLLVCLVALRRTDGADVGRFV